MILVKIFKSEISFGYKLLVLLTIIGLLCSILGASLNTLVKLSNGGKMPVITAPPYITKTDVEIGGNHCPLTSKTKFPFLADTIIIAEPDPNTETMRWISIISPGDILIYIGLMLTSLSALFCLAKLLFLLFSLQLIKRT